MSEPIVDNRAGVGDGTPGVHALIVGVSNYSNLPDEGDLPHPEWKLNKLTCAASSAHAIFEWVKTNPLRLPIKSIRLLLSPSPVEIAKIAGLDALSPRANRQNFKDAARAWRTDASKNPADMTIFYFAGHGMQRGPEEGILLLDDFLAGDDTVLAKAAELGNIRNGLAPSDDCPQIGLTQFYFIDACLDRPKAQNKFVNPQVPPIFDVLLNVVDRREAPVLFSTFDGALSIGRRGKTTSYFAEALMLAFERGAEDPEDVPAGGTRWPVTSVTIKNSLDAFYDRNKLGTNVTLSSLVGLPVLRYLNDAPDVACKICVDPQRMNGTCRITVCDDVDAPAAGIGPQTTTEFDFVVKAGFYKVSVDSSLLRTNPYKSKLKWITQKVKSWPHSLDSLLVS
jgi:hypothetical protein